MKKVFAEELQPGDVIDHEGAWRTVRNVTLGKPGHDRVMVQVERPNTTSYELVFIPKHRVTVMSL